MSRGPADRHTSSIRLLQLTAFTSTLDRFAMPPMLVAIALDLGVPLSQAVQVAGAYFLAYGLMQPVWGMVSDSLGLVRTLRPAAALSTLGTTMRQAGSPADSRVVASAAPAMSVDFTKSLRCIPLLLIR